MKEIKESFLLCVEPGKTRADVRGRAEAKIADVEEKIKTLRAMKKSLAKITTACRGDGPVKSCPILESLNHEE